MSQLKKFIHDHGTEALKLELQKKDENGYFQIALKDMNSAELNSWLVKNGISVTELIVQRTSLSKLFKKITSEPEK